MNNELELSTKIPLRRKYPPYEAANLYMNNIINDVLFLFFIIIRKMILIQVDIHYILIH